MILHAAAHDEGSGPGLGTTPGQ